MTAPTLAILAGGEGSRMGQPKSLLTIDQKPILEFLLDQFQWRGPTLLITAPGREHPPASELFTKECVDPVAGLGPLRGILTALENSQTSLVLFATVDMPHITAAQLHWLVQKLSTEKESLGLFTRRHTADIDQIEPFPSIFRTTATDTLRARLAAGMRSVYSLQDQPHFSVSRAPPDWPESVWTNLNVPEELNAFLATRSRTN